MVDLSPGRRSLIVFFGALFAPYSGFSSSQKFFMVSRSIGPSVSTLNLGFRPTSSHNSLISRARID